MIFLSRDFKSLVSTIPPLGQLAGVDGFEPSHARVKVSCLTAWLHPKIFGAVWENRTLNICLEGRGLTIKRIRHWSPHVESDHAYLGMSLASSQTIRRYGRDTTICTLINNVGDCCPTVGRYPYMVPTDGIEPSTYCLQGSCSTNWAKPAYGVPSGIRTRDVALKGLWLDRLSMGTYGGDKGSRTLVIRVMSEAIVIRVTGECNNRYTISPSFEAF